MALIDPKTPQRSDLERMCGGNQRLVKAFEKLFQLLPTIADPSTPEVEAAQISADNANAQAFLAISLVEAVTQIAELVVTEPKHVCTCKQNEDLSPRSEVVIQDTILPASQLTEPMNINLEVT
ncbi:hypothetical protein [Acinetobacter dispersus]|uniref:hypothetical protein n=1 Tax=Acinetobacter dispersus TaxID=70348 RepID=UPI001F4A45C3|nr:hypothetical protein [Acinetobacter dispersus]MCH7391817.1 hypothetical protein [Acinetobacter dispersus]